MRPARLLATILSIAALTAPLAAIAQQIPAAAPAPSYARPNNLNGEESIRGRVISFDGKYRLQVNDERGFIDAVELHQGTVINPTGLALRPGMAVTILGYNRGRTFAANQVDTPYQTYGFAPAYPAYAPISVGIGFGPVYYHHWH